MENVTEDDFMHLWSTNRRNQYNTRIEQNESSRFRWTVIIIYIIRKLTVQEKERDAKQTVKALLVQFNKALLNYFAYSRTHLLRMSCQEIVMQWDSFNFFAPPGLV